MSTSFVHQNQLVLSRTSFVTFPNVALSKEISREFGRRFQAERERAHLTQEQETAFCYGYTNAVSCDKYWCFPVHHAHSASLRSLSPNSLREMFTLQK